MGIVRDLYYARKMGAGLKLPAPSVALLIKRLALSKILSPAVLKTVTGALLHITDALAKPAVELLCDLSPIQSLNGYSSPWPAGGGVNKFDKDSLSDASVYVTEYNQYYYTSPIILKPNTAYIMTPTSVSELGTSKYYVLYFNQDASDATYLNPINANLRYPVAAGTPASVTFTTGATGAIRFAIPKTGSAPDATALAAFMSIDYQLEEGSTASTWMPYSNICPISGRTGLSVYVSPTQNQADATEYAADWTSAAGTVYGGTLDVVSGVLTVTHQFGTLTASGKSTSGAGYFWYTTSDAMSLPGIADTNAGLISNRMRPVSNVTEGNPDGVIAFYANHIIRWKEQGSLSKADYETYLASNPLQICYELATPLTYQLTAQEVDLLLGENYLWRNDSGDLQLTYYADGNANTEDALNLLLGNRYVNNHTPEDVSDREALDILLGR